MYAHHWASHDDLFASSILSKLPWHVCYHRRYLASWREVPSALRSSVQFAEDDEERVNQDEFMGLKKPILTRTSHFTGSLRPVREENL